MPIAPKDTELTKRLRRWFKEANDADAKQDERERDDIAFEDGEQWPVEIALARKGQQPVNGMPAVPARPTLVIDKVKEPVRQILNQERAADIGIEITPADDFGDLGITPDEDEITLREGLVRRIQRASHAADARTWAFKRAVIAGRGYYIVRTRYLPGKTNDQEIYIDRIYNQAGVKLDPSHQQPDGSDADWEFIGTWMSWDRFKSEYPKDAEGKNNPVIDANEADFMGLTENYPDWYKGGESADSHRAVRIVDCWYVERTPRELVTLPDGTSHWRDELNLPKSEELPEGTDSRMVSERKILFCKLAGGLVVLEQTEESGPDMPIVKVIGDEVLPYDEQRRYNGIVRPARGACQGFNATVSKAVELTGLTPIPPLMVDPEAIEGYEEWYKVANTRALPYLPYRSMGDNGQAFAAPTRTPADPNLGPVTQMVAMFADLIQTTTAVPDPMMGKVDPATKSGKAINALVQNAQMGSSNYLDNYVRALQYEGQVVNNKLYMVYGTRPGRLVRVLTGENEEQTMAVGAMPQSQQQQALRQKALKVAKLTKDANFNVVIKITKNYDSRRTQEYTELGQLISAEPNLMGWFGDLYLKNSDMPNRTQLSERAKVMLVPQIQEMLAKQEQGQTFDPAAQAQIQQMQQQLQELQQYAQQAQKALETKQIETQARMQEAQAKAQADAQKAQFEAQRDLELEQLKANLQIELQKMQNATTIRVAEINAQIKGIISGHELQHEQQALGIEMQNQQEMAMMAQDHERGMAETQAQMAERQQMMEQQAAQQEQQA